MNHLMKILVFLSLTTFCLGEIKGYNSYNQNSRNTYQQNAGYVDNLEWSGYNYNVNQGQCRGTKLVDEEVRKEADPYTIKKTTYTWSGRDMFYITCVKVENRMPRNDKAAEARIVTGGVGQGKVSIEMISKNSQKLQFQIEIWGEATRQQAENLAVMTNTPNKILYLGGKKYCECR